jgi:MFS transporter, DHA3 family, macrolide efflux protein
MSAAAASPKRRPSPFAVFRSRNFTLLWLAQFVSTMGSALTTVAASILVFRETGTALSVGLMLLVSVAPGLLVGMLAGVFVDRVDRKRVMIASELVRAALTIAIPLLLPLGVAWLYALAAASSVVKQFFDPAQASVLPEVASDEELAAANSLMTISFVGADILGFSLAGLIAANLDIVLAFYIDGFSFVVSGLCLLLLRLPARAARPGGSPSVRDDLREGVAFVGRTRMLRALFLIFIPVFALFGSMQALNLPFIVRTVGAGELAFGLVEGVGLSGFVLGSCWMAAHAHRLRDGQWVTISLLGMGVFGTAYALLSSLPLLILINGIYYVLNAFSYIGRQLLIQRGTPPELRGRVNGAFFVTRDACLMVGMLLAGAGDVLGVRTVLVVCGAGLVACGLLTLRMPGLGTWGAAGLPSIPSLLRVVTGAGHVNVAGGAGAPAAPPVSGDPLVSGKRL